MSDTNSPDAAVKEPSDADPGSGPARFQFLRYGVLRVSFQEIQKQSFAEGEKPEPHPVKTVINAQIGMREGLQADVVLTVDVIPDPRVRPYEIQVTVIGAFGTKNGSQEQLAEFCMRSAPSMLFPFVRQIVHNISADGRFGRVLLRPMNLHGTLKQDGWSKVEPPPTTLLP